MWRSVSMSNNKTVLSHDYNKYPDNMVEIDINKSGMWLEYFFCAHESYETRQAHPDGDIYVMYEELRITWIDKKLGIGYALGYKDGVVKFYKIGSQVNWGTYRNRVASSQY